MGRGQGGTCLADLRHPLSHREHAAGGGQVKMGHKAHNDNVTEDGSLRHWVTPTPQHTRTQQWLGK